MSKETSGSVLSQREKSKANRRTAIIEIAQRSFFEKGFENTTMSDIAKEMGGSKGTLWTYFKSKEELISAVLENMSTGFQSFISIALNSNEEIETVLLHFCETYIARICKPDAIAFQRLVVSQAGRFPVLAQIFYEGGPAINHMMVSNFIGRQMLAGVLRVDDVDEATRMLIDLCTAGWHDLVLYGLKSQDDSEEKKQAKRVVKQFLRCYGTQR
jgi:TetR/AcrR family transcriptional repressor of mexJK operon